MVDILILFLYYQPTKHSKNRVNCVYKNRTLTESRTLVASVGHCARDEDLGSAVRCSVLQRDGGNLLQHRLLLGGSYRVGRLKTILGRSRIPRDRVTTVRCTGCCTAARPAAAVPHAFVKTFTQSGVISAHCNIHVKKENIGSIP